MQNTRFKVCLHHFVGAHGARSLDQYPRRFVSVGVAESDAAKPLAGVRPDFRDRGAWMVMFSRVPRSQRPDHDLAVHG